MVGQAGNPRLPRAGRGAIRCLLALAAWLAACGSAVAVADPAPGDLAASPTAHAGPAGPGGTPAAGVPSPTLSSGPSSPAAPTTTPVPTASAAPTTTPVLLGSPTAVPEIVLVFAGDINPGRCVYAKARDAGDMGLPFAEVAQVLRAADIAVGSLDGTLSDANPVPPCVETHRNLLGPPEMAGGMAWAGFDVITVATNHAKDCGLVRGCLNESMFDTAANLRAAGIAPAGSGANLAEAMTPAIVTVQGVRFAFLGVTAINTPLWATEGEPGVGPFRSEVYLQAIRQAREAADVVVVLPHWGREFSSQITYTQRRAALEMIEAGATLVVGNHPHRVQGVETLPGAAAVAYALGNFVFDMTWSDGTLYTIQGVMLKARFRGASLQDVSLLPYRIYDDFQPRLVEGAEAEQILAAVAGSMAAAPPP